MRVGVRVLQARLWLSYGCVSHVLAIKCTAGMNATLRDVRASCRRATWPVPIHPHTWSITPQP